MLHFNKFSLLLGYNAIELLEPHEIGMLIFIMKSLAKQHLLRYGRLEWIQVSYHIFIVLQLQKLKSQVLVSL